MTKYLLKWWILLTNTKEMKKYKIQRLKELYGDVE